LEIVYLKNVDSTHKFLLKKLSEKKLFAPIAIVSEEQNSGIGTKDREWIGYKGNLFLSFCIEKSDLPHDLPLGSVSIYYAYILKEILFKKGSKVWLKWPNDFYLHDKKIGGVLTTIKGKNIICSIGLNLKKSPNNFQIIDINIEKDELIELYFLKLKQVIFWKYIFRHYKIEFEKSRGYETTINGTKKISLGSAKLQDDGSILLENRRVYSLR